MPCRGLCRLQSQERQHTILPGFRWESPVDEYGVGDDQREDIAVAAQEGLVEVVGPVHGVHHLPTGTSALLQLRFFLKENPCIMF